MKSNSLFNFISTLMDSEDYKDARLIVINEYHIVISSMLQEVKLKSVLKLLDYELVKWATDYANNDGSDNLQQDTECNVIKTLVIFVEKVSA